MLKTIYIKSIYELKDIDDNTLYIKTVDHCDYTYFSNRLFLDECILYNLDKDIEKIKFSIKFQKINHYRIAKMWYVKNDNYRLIIKKFWIVKNIF